MATDPAGIPEWLKWASAILTSSFASGIYAHWRISRENRIRSFKMTIADVGNVSAVPAEYLGEKHDSIRYIEYHIKNKSGKDFGQLVLAFGFKCGRVIKVITRSEVFGGDGANKTIEGETQVTIGIPVFNRDDILIIRAELANCGEIELGWIFVKSHPGVQVEIEYEKYKVQGHPQGNQTSPLRLQRGTLISRVRRTLAAWIQPRN